MSAELAHVRLPPECREMIRAGTLVAINHSGGKDSQAMTIMLSRIVPRDQLVAVHAPLGDVEWPGTIEHIEATLPADVPLVFAPVASGKTLLSCSFCILASRADLRRAAELRPDLYRAYAELERRIGHTLSPTGRPLPEVTGVPLAARGGPEDLADPLGARPDMPARRRLPAWRVGSGPCNAMRKGQRRFQ